MAEDTVGLVIELGDKVAIKVGKDKFTGKVISAEYIVGDGGWHIELDSGVLGEYEWKQCYDGGRVVIKNGAIVECSTQEESQADWDEDEKATFGYQVRENGAELDAVITYTELAEMIKVMKEDK